MGSITRYLASNVNSPRSRRISLILTRIAKKRSRRLSKRNAVTSSRGLDTSRLALITEQAPEVQAMDHALARVTSRGTPSRRAPRTREALKDRQICPMWRRLSTNNQEREAQAKVPKTRVKKRWGKIQAKPWGPLSQVHQEQLHQEINCLKKVWRMQRLRTWSVWGPFQLVWQALVIQGLCSSKMS